MSESELIIKVKPELVKNDFEQELREIVRKVIKEELLLIAKTRTIVVNNHLGNS